MKKSKNLQKRKKDHLKFALSDDAQIGDPGFDRYRFVHNALPEINFDKIDTSTVFLGKKVNYPFFISCMTGGVEKGATINSNLAKAAQKMGIAMGVGSQRIAIEHPEFERLFKVRKYAPDIPIMANLGLVQLNYGYGLSQCQRAVETVEVDALVFHINPIQEVIQPEGDRNFSDLLPKLAKIVKKLSVPVIVKEVGFGLSEDVISRLYNVGVRIFDTAGWGGTNWAWVEGERRRTKRLGQVFSQWGIPTVESIKICNDFNSQLTTNPQPTTHNSQLITILGSGGVRSGMDIAKCLALGADLVGLAAPFAKAALVSSSEVEKLIESLAQELKVAMFGVGADSIKKLQEVSFQNNI